ncbi:MAG: hypothetical protein K9J37_02410 [Saprospiraceae bacterium]|nr:hypothetical protein [Saprospiraceae bacterium]MCF8248732.1 hypothetical protein [Saprospiraceae bacterium]MCF8278778.1 hypothetical protein [Bacteroidales bacterium]MCF8310578.1 hypothetical protein [Saprospiraceae bacterium]MCF8439137.1 hypothetical protein [Saprospiraceae bacterium]
MKPITESHIEQSAIETLQAQGWAYMNGKDISPEGIACERESFSQIILTGRLREAVAVINLLVQGLPHNAGPTVMKLDWAPSI